MKYFSVKIFILILVERKTILNGAAINRADLDEVTHNCPLSYFRIAAGTFICDILCLSMGLGLLFILSTYELWSSLPEGFFESSSFDLCFMLKPISYRLDQIGYIIYIYYIYIYDIGFMNHIVLYVCLHRRLIVYKVVVDHWHEVNLVERPEQWDSIKISRKTFR